MQEIEGIGVEEGDEEGDNINTKGDDIDEKAEGKGFKRKRTSKAAKINAQLGQVDNVTKNGDPDTSRKNMLGSGEISNPFPQGDADSFVNKSDDVPAPKKKEGTSIRKKRKNKGSKRFELNDKG